MGATWVVFEGRLGHQPVWCWGLHDGRAGFERVEFTDTSGFDLEAELDGIPEFTRYLFSVPAFEEEMVHGEHVIANAAGRVVAKIQT